MSTSTLSIALGFAFLAFGIYKIWQLVRQQQRRSASQTWPVIAADVISKKVAESRSPKSGTSYFPEITYKYTHMGQEFEKQTRLSGLYSRKSAEDAIFNVGKTIEVRYNPDNPKEHIAETDKNNFWDILQVVATLVVAIAILSQLFL